MTDLPEWLSLGLIGYPLGHSLSPQLHAAALSAMGLDGEYLLYPIAPGVEMEASFTFLFKRVRSGELRGLNITIPHKQAVRRFLDEVTLTARAVGAVNTIFVRDGRLVGDNTDAPGFLSDLHRVFPALQDRKTAASGTALVLGAGGAARAATYALASAGWRVVIAARRLEQAAELAGVLQFGVGNGPRQDIQPLLLDAGSIASLPESPVLLVNASSAGMLPNGTSSPWPAGIPLPPDACVYDLVYNPAETMLLRQACESGLEAAGGLGMLIEQAALALERWTGLPVPRTPMWNAVPASKKFSPKDR